MIQEVIWVELSTVAIVVFLHFQTFFSNPKPTARRFHFPDSTSTCATS